MGSHITYLPQKDHFQSDTPSGAEAMDIAEAAGGIDRSMTGYAFISGKFIYVPDDPTFTTKPPQIPNSPQYVIMGSEQQRWRIA